MKKTLKSLIQPKSTDDFFKSYESNIPFVVHGLSESISNLTALPFLKSLSDLMTFWPKEVEVHLPDLADEASAVQATTEKALEMHECGMGLLFNDANTESPILTRWLESLRQDMGLSMHTYGRNLIYATKAGKGTAPHFDQNINFVIQIHGTKKWWIAPNKNVVNPMTRHTMGQEVDSELASYIKAPMPNKMPDDATEITLQPGSMLFVPRGSWHTTEAVTDALALNFTYSAPNWIDLFSAALRSRLALSPKWRQTADFVSGDNKSPEVIAQFNELLTELSYDAQNWHAEDILAAVEPKQ